MACFGEALFVPRNFGAKKPGCSDSEAGNALKADLSLPLATRIEYLVGITAAVARPYAVDHRRL